MTSYSHLPPPTKWPNANQRLLGLGAGLPISPLDRLAQFDDVRFERLTLEWADGFLKKAHGADQVQQRGGSGDKGRDIVVWLDPPDTTPRRSMVFQCKHYASRLSAGDAALEIGKLIFYTGRGDYPVPNRYEFVTHLGVTGGLQDLLDNPAKLKEFVLANWDKYCRKKITSKCEVQLDATLKAHLEGLDFSIFRAKQPHELIQEHAQTPYHLTVFGAPLIERPPPPAPPSTIDAIEAVYVAELLKAISLEEGKAITCENDLQPTSAMGKLFSRSRLSFYSAEGLRELSRDQMADMQHFSKLLDEFENGLFYWYTDSSRDGVDLLKYTVQGAQALQLTGQLLTQHVTAADREGLCHHLVNDRGVRWCDGK